MLITLKKLDRQLFLLINRYRCGVGDWIGYWATHECFWLPWYGWLVYRMTRSLQRKTPVALLAVFILIILCDQFASGLIKPWTKRLRPCLDPQIQHLVYVVSKYRGKYGFISSHAANTFGLARFLWFVIGSHDPCSFWLWIWAAGVSYARIYGGVHYPTDVLLGALSGLFWARLVYQGYNYITTL